MLSRLNHSIGITGKVDEVSSVLFCNDDEASEILKAFDIDYDPSTHNLISVHISLQSYLQTAKFAPKAVKYTKAFSLIQHKLEFPLFPLFT